MTIDIEYILYMAIAHIKTNLRLLTIVQNFIKPTRKQYKRKYYIFFTNNYMKVRVLHGLHAARLNSGKRYQSKLFAQKPQKFLMSHIIINEEIFIQFPRSIPIRQFYYLTQRFLFPYASFLN